MDTDSLAFFSDKQMVQGARVAAYSNTDSSADFSDHIMAQDMAARTPEMSEDAQAVALSVIAPTAPDTDVPKSAFYDKNSAINLRREPVESVIDPAIEAEIKPSAPYVGNPNQPIISPEIEGSHNRVIPQGNIHGRLPNSGLNTATPAQIVTPLETALPPRSEITSPVMAVDSAASLNSIAPLSSPQHIPQDIPSLSPASMTQTPTEPAHAHNNMDKGGNDPMGKPAQIPEAPISAIKTQIDQNPDKAIAEETGKITLVPAAQSSTEKAVVQAAGISQIGEFIQELPDLAPPSIDRTETGSKLLKATQTVNDTPTRETRAALENSSHIAKPPLPSALNTSIDPAPNTAVPPTITADQPQTVPAGLTGFATQSLFMPQTITPAQIVPILNSGVTPGAAHLTQVLDSLVQAVSHKKGVVVRLSPPEMGRVYIDFQFTDSQNISATLRAETPEMTGQLRDNAAVLQQLLKENGFININLNFSNGSEFQNEADRKFSDQATSYAAEATGLAELEAEPVLGASHNPHANMSGAYTDSLNLKL